MRPGTRVPVSVRPSQVQARAEGVAPAPALPFFGCHAPESDLYHADELAGLAARGIVDVRPAFSRAPVDGVRHVQRLWADRADRADLVALVRDGAVSLVCGDGQRTAPAVHDTCRRIHFAATGASPQESGAWLTATQREHGRHVADVFA